MNTSSARSHRRSRTLDDPRFERYRNVRTRRHVAAALIAVQIVEAALFVVLDHATWPVLAGLAVVLVALVICFGLLKASTRGIEELPEQALDERQRELRGAIFATAYRIGSGLLIAGLATVALWAMLDLPTPSRGVITAALVLPFQMALMLPTLVAALRDDV